jgi:hypothetical protein
VTRFFAGAFLAAGFFAVVFFGAVAIGSFLSATNVKALPRLK